MAALVAERFAHTNQVEVIFGLICFLALRLFAIGPSCVMRGLCHLSTCLSGSFFFSLQWVRCHVSLVTSNMDFQFRELPAGPISSLKAIFSVFKALIKLPLSWQSDHLCNN
jgi:hypothetical protein